VIRIPRSLFGLSTEYWTLPVDEHHTLLDKRELSMLHVPRDGRFIPQIGGDTSDHAVFDPSARLLSPWASARSTAASRRTRPAEISLPSPTAMIPAPPREDGALTIVFVAERSSGPGGRWGCVSK
jgi:hypothetical protein